MSYSQDIIEKEKLPYYAEYSKLVEIVWQFCIEYKLSDDHGFVHATIVAQNAQDALDDNMDFPSEKYYLIVMAALLHDLDDRKLFPKNKNFENATGCLKEIKLAENDIEEVIKMISLVSASKNGNTVVNPLWMYIPRDSDRVEALGIIGIERAWEYTAYVKMPIVTKETELVTSDDELSKLDLKKRYQDYIAGGGVSRSMIDHMYDKLLNISTLSSGNTYLQFLANNRHNIMKKWLFEVCQAIKSSGVQLPIYDKFWKYVNSTLIIDLK